MGRAINEEELEDGLIKLPEGPAEAHVPFLESVTDEQLRGDEGNGLDLALQTDEDLHSLQLKNVWRESGRLWHLAGPITIMYVLVFGLGAVCTAIVGRISPLHLASASVASVFANVTGFSVIVGLCSALETFCGQAYGAKEYRQVGEHVQRAMAVMLAISIPIAALWYSSERILLLLGQEPAISELSSQCLLWLIPSLVLRCTYEPIQIYLQAQGHTMQMAVCTFVSCVVTVPSCYILSHPLGFGALGLAMSQSLGSASAFVTLLVWLQVTKIHQKTWYGWSKAAFRGWGSFLARALPSAAMLCFEWWCYELVVLLAGLLPEAEIKVSAISIIINGLLVAIMVPLSLGDAVSARVGNELGAANALLARLASFTSMGWGLASGLIMGVILLVFRNQFGVLFTNEERVIALVAQCLPLLAIALVFDSIQLASNGVLRGAGHQMTGATINLFAYYVVGLPLATLFSFVFKLELIGLWIGITLGALLQDAILLTFVYKLNWKQEAETARIMVLEQSQYSAASDGVQ